MEWTSLIQDLAARKGNYNSYISYDNLKDFVRFLHEYSGDFGEMILGPFLIKTTEPQSVYELLYHGFEINYKNIESVQWSEYPEENALPAEIVQNIKPAAAIPVGDKKSYLYALDMYIDKIGKMRFEDERQYLSDFSERKLFFECFSCE